MHVATPVPSDWVPLKLVVPKPIALHLQRRIAERSITQQDLLPLWDWVASKPLVPPGDWYKPFPKFILVGSGQFPKSVLEPQMKPWGVRLAAAEEFGEDEDLPVFLHMKTALATMSEVTRIAQEFMPILKPGLPFPKFKIVNNTGSRWLGRDVYKGAVDLYNTTIELQKSILGDDHTLRSIIAHELCHHEDTLLNWIPLSQFQKRNWDGHGPSWQAIAERFNARFGAGFVNKTSDESHTLTDLGNKFYLLILRKGERWMYAISVRPSNKQIEYINRYLETTRLIQEGETGSRLMQGQEARLFVSTDPEISTGSGKIGSAWSVPRGSLLEKIENIWDTGEQVTPPGAKRELTEEEIASSKGIFVLLVPFSNVDAFTVATLVNPTPREKDSALFWVQHGASGSTRLFKVTDPYWLTAPRLNRGWGTPHLAPGETPEQQKQRIQRLYDTGTPVRVIRNDKGKEVLDLKDAPVSKAAATKYKYGTVQAELPEDSDAYAAVVAVREEIDPSDLDGNGLNIGPTHITVRYGIQTDDTSTIEAYLSKQAPMLAKLGATSSFPPSESSDNAAVLIAPVECPELFAINEQLANEGDFMEPTFDYKPHVTVAYLKPEVIEKYVGNDTTAGQEFVIKEVAVVNRANEKKIIALNGKAKTAAVSEASSFLSEDGKVIHRNSRSLEKQYDRFEAWVASLSFPLTLYRAFDKSPSDIDWDNLGVYWAVDESNAQVHFGDRDSDPTVITAEVRRDAVDWEETFYQNVRYGWGETEITLKRGADVRIISVDPPMEPKLNPVGQVKTADGPTQDQDHMGKPGDITDTPAFKAWFAGSKVVDDHGRPLRVYHGTDQEFDMFHRNSWFALDPSNAKAGGTSDAAYIIPVYLRVLNPYVLNDGELKEFRHATINASTANKMGRRLLQKAKEDGHDGVLVPGYAYLVPNPRQIKSAIGNNGDFDPTDNRITASTDVAEVYSKRISTAAKATINELRKAGWSLNAIQHGLQSEYVIKYQILPISKTVLTYWKLRQYGRRGESVYQRFLEATLQAANAAANSPGNPARFASMRLANPVAVQSPQFKSWFRGSKVVDRRGNPLPVYHGTTHDFDTFRADGGDEEGFYGSGIYFTNSKEDASANYAGVGPDLEHKIERETERLFNDKCDAMLDSGELDAWPRWGSEEYKSLLEQVKKEVEVKLKGPHDGMVLPCYLRITNPVVVAPRGGTYFTIELDEETSEESGSGLALYENFMNEFVKHMDWDDAQKLWNQATENLDYSHFSAFDFEVAVRGNDYAVEIENGPGSVLARTYREMGFDGIIMDANEQFPGMDLERNTKHFIVWRPNQVKSAIGNSGEFDPEKESIVASKRSKLLNPAA